MGGRCVTPNYGDPQTTAQWGDQPPDRTINLPGHRGVGELRPGARHANIGNFAATVVVIALVTSETSLGVGDHPIPPGTDLDYLQVQEKISPSYL